VARDGPAPARLYCPAADPAGARSNASDIGLALNGDLENAGKCLVDRLVMVQGEDGRRVAEARERMYQLVWAQGRAGGIRPDGGRRSRGSGSQDHWIAAQLIAKQGGG
jgi:hypothetical protein